MTGFLPVQNGGHRWTSTACIGDIDFWSFRHSLWQAKKKFHVKNKKYRLATHRLVMNIYSFLFWMVKVPQRKTQRSLWSSLPTCCRPRVISISPWIIQKGPFGGIRARHILRIWLAWVCWSSGVYPQSEKRQWLEMQGVKDVGTTKLLATKMGLHQGTRPNLTYLRVQCIAISKGVEQCLSPKPD